MTGSRSREWNVTRAIEDTMAHLVDLQVTLRVWMALARMIGNRDLLRSAYDAERQLYNLGAALTVAWQLSYEEATDGKAD